MSLFKVFDIAGSAMSAQSVRLNTVASNMANADSVSSSVEKLTTPGGQSLPPSWIRPCPTSRPRSGWM